MTYSFLKRMIFSLTLLDIYCLEFISHRMKEILYVNTNSEVFLLVQFTSNLVSILSSNVIITLSSSVIFSSKYCNVARIQKIWNMNFVQNYKFPKIFRCFQQNSHCWTSESCRTLKTSQNMSNKYKLKVTKTDPTPVYTFWNFKWKVEIGLIAAFFIKPLWWLLRNTF